MSYVKPGDKIRISALDWNSMQDAAAAHRQGKLSARGFVLSAAQPTKFRNDEAAVIPLGGVGYVSDTVYEGVHKATYPVTGLEAALVVAAEPGAADKIFGGWTEGIRKVKVAAAEFAGISVQDRIGPQAASWEAVPDAYGPLLVVGKLTSPYVMALIIGRYERPDQRFQNDEADAVPIGGVGWMADDAGDGIVSVLYPPNPGVSTLVVSAEAKAAGDLFAGYTTGPHLFRIKAASFASVSVGDRVGPDTDSWDAIPNPLGPIRVIGKYDSPYALGVITGQRGDHKLVKTASGLIDVEVLLMDSHHTIAQDANGIITSTYVP